MIPNLRLLGAASKDMSEKNDIRRHTALIVILNSSLFSLLIKSLPAAVFRAPFSRGPIPLDGSAAPCEIPGAGPLNYSAHIPDPRQL